VGGGGKKAGIISGAGKKKARGPITKTRETQREIKPGTEKKRIVPWNGKEKGCQEGVGAKKKNPTPHLTSGHRKFKPDRNYRGVVL